MIFEIKYPYLKGYRIIDDDSVEIKLKFDIRLDDSCAKVKPTL